MIVLLSSPVVSRCSSSACCDNFLIRSILCLLLWRNNAECVDTLDPILVMAFVYSSQSTKPKAGEVKVEYVNRFCLLQISTLTCRSIVCVPAIGADPRKTWERQTDTAGFEHRRLDYVLHDRLFPAARVHLYDHLTRQERGLELKPPEGPNDSAHKRSAEEFAAGEAQVAAFGVAEWADRFFEIVQKHRRDERPILFICHSTGGIVVKQALSKKNTDGQNSIASCCLGVTFFSAPHHGSSVLSDPEYVQTVRNHLGLKWEMSETLRQDFVLRSADLEVGISLKPKSRSLNLERPIRGLFSSHVCLETRKSSLHRQR